MLCSVAIISQTILWDLWVGNRVVSTKYISINLKIILSMSCKNEAFHVHGKVLFSWFKYNIITLKF